jgi:hypothetical protein
MFIDQASQGSLLLSDLYAAIPHTPVVRPVWTLVGWVGGLLRVGPPVAFQLVRLALIPIFFCATYLFLAAVFSQERVRKLSLVFLAASSGFGFFFIHRLVQNPLNYNRGAFQWPMDLWVPDINTFLTLHTSPHFIAATILLLVIFLQLLLFLRRPLWRYAIVAGLGGGLLFLIHPFQIVKIFAILGVFGIMRCLALGRIERKLAGFGAIFLGLSSPAIGYYVWLLRTDHLTLLRTLQNINPSTPPWLTLVALGGLGIGAAVGLTLLIRRRQLIDPAMLLLAVWAVVQFGLLYAPLSYQRRMVLGFHVPLVCLTVIALVAAQSRWPGQVKKFLPQLVMLGILLFLPSSMFALAADVMVFQQARELSYLHIDEKTALDWLRQESPTGSVVYSAVKTGLVLPAYSLRSSYVGHAVETPDYVGRKLEPNWFFAVDRPEEIERAYLERRGINYLWYGRREQELGTFNPAMKNYLEPVVELPTVTLYQVL